MTFARLRAFDWVALVAALALLFVSAMDWYSATTGDEARRIEGISQPSGALGGEADRQLQEETRIAAEGQKNAWQASGGIDGAILLALLGTVALGIFAAFARAAGRGSRAALPLSALVGLAGAATALLVTYRMVQEPGFDESTTIKAGAPLALIVLAVLALASAQSLGADEEAEPEADRPPWEAAA